MSTGRVGATTQRRRRLTKSGDFDRAYRKGHSYAGDYLVIYRFDREDRAEDNPQGVRLGISVSRKIGNAVKRNRIKRLLKEAFWSLGSEPRTGCDYVVVARRDIVGLAEKEGLAGFRQALQSVLSKAEGGA